MVLVTIEDAIKNIENFKELFLDADNDTIKIKVDPYKEILSCTDYDKNHVRCIGGNCPGEHVLGDFYQIFEIDIDYLAPLADLIIKYIDGQIPSVVRKSNFQGAASESNNRMFYVNDTSSKVATDKGAPFTTVVELENGDERKQFFDAGEAMNHVKKSCC